MSGIILEVLILILLLLINGIFVMSEMAVVSSRKARLQQLANEGNKRAAAALDAGTKPHNFPFHSTDRDHTHQRLVGRIRRPRILGAPGSRYFNAGRRSVPMQIRWPSVSSWCSSRVSPWWWANLSPNAWHYINRKEMAAAISGPMSVGLKIIHSPGLDVGTHH